MLHIGCGTAGLGSLNYDIVCACLKSGFVLFDTAQAPEWYVEREVGRAIKDYNCYNYSTQDGDIFVVTKVHPRTFSYDAMNDAVLNSLQLLSMKNKLDAVLIHAPFCWPGHCTYAEEQHTWHTAWNSLVRLKKENLIENIGVSNFDIHLLREMELKNYPLPSIVQNWMDPFHQDALVREFCKERGITYMGYSSFGTQWFRLKRNPVFSSVVLNDIAREYNISVTDVVLDFLYQLNVIALPRSSSFHHIEMNAAHIKRTRNDRFALSKESIHRIQELDGILGDPY